MSEFVGNRAIYSLLNESLKKDTIAHAYIFAGQDGIGKKLLALHLAKSISCLSGHTGLKFCGECSSCKKVDSGSHPDVQLIKPEGKVFKIGQVREIIRDIYYMPFEGNKRVFILEDAHAMNEEAANSLLKTLEEPPLSSMIILLTNNLYALLPTVRSRSQILKFSPIPDNEIEQFLVKQCKMDPQAAKKAAHLAMGSLGEAISFDEDLFREGQKWSILVLKSMIYDDDSAVFDHIQRASKNENNFDFYVKILVSLLRDLTIIDVFNDDGKILHREAINTLYEFSRKLSPKIVQDIFYEIEKLYLKRTLNLRLEVMLQNVMFKCRNLILRGEM